MSDYVRVVEDFLSDVMPANGAVIVRQGRGRSMLKYLGVGCLVLVGPALAGCGDCEKEQSAVRQFIETHQSCEVDDDCVVVSTGCFTIPSGLCGQAIMSREASETAEWHELQGDLFDCQDDCAVCAASLMPGTCEQGSCTRDR